VRNLGQTIILFVIVENTFDNTLIPNHYVSVLFGKFNTIEIASNVVKIASNVVKIASNVVQIASNVLKISFENTRTKHVICVRFTNVFFYLFRFTNVFFTCYALQTYFFTCYHNLFSLGPIKILQASCTY
jgi:hypothetical protein